MENRVDLCSREESEDRRNTPQDMRKCAFASYIWGKKISIMVDVMVLGNSLKEHGNKAQRYLCVTDDTEDSRLACLMQAFWTCVPVTHVDRAAHLQWTEIQRLQGVYSKL